MGKPPFKASDGDRFDMLWVWKDSRASDLQQVSEMHVPIALEARPEAFPTGLPMSVWDLIIGMK
jgi:hypothetical protein